MARKTLKLGCPEVAKVIDVKHREEKPGWRKDRLLVIKLASRGEHTAAEIAEIAGIARSQVFAFVKAVRVGGLEAIWEKDRAGRPEGDRKGVPEEVSAEFERKLAGHEFTTLQDARRWLLAEHGLEVTYQRVWYWAKKLGGVLRVPRPSHSRKDPAAACEFRDELGGKLESLGLVAGTRAKVWVMDEARFGQISGVNLEWDRSDLENLAATDPGAVHVIIRDQEGFHLRDGDARLPANVRIIDLPPYRPELNPCEQLRDLVKDRISNRVFKTIEELREAMEPVLAEWWTDSQRVFSLIGRPWLHDQANASSKI